LFNRLLARNSRFRACFHSIERFSQRVGEQPQGPVAPATGRIGTRKFDQLLFNVPFNFDLVGSGRPWLGVKGRLDPLDDKPLPDAGDGSGACTQSSDDVLVAGTLAMNRVREEQDSGVGKLAARRFADGDESFQGGTLFRFQCDPVLFHPSAPSLGGRFLNVAPSNRRPFYPSIVD
jgi:hypothetical protein